MPGSRFHPYLSSQDEVQASATYLENPFRPYSITNKTDLATPSILNSSPCPPHPSSPRQALSTPYSVMEGTRWQPDVGWSASHYSPMEQNLLAMEQQRLALQQQQWMEATKQQDQMEALRQHQWMETPKQKQQIEALWQQHQMEALQQQQWMEASKQKMEALRHQQSMAATSQQQWMEAPNLMYIADSSQEFIGYSQEYIRYMEDSSQEYNRYMEDSSQEYIRYMDSSQEYIRYMEKLRHISAASILSKPTVPVLPTLSVPLSCQSPMQDQPLNLSLKDRFEDSTRGSSDLSTTHSSSLASSSSDSMSAEKFTGSNTSPEPSLVKLSHSKTESSLAKLTLPKKRSYQPNSAMITEFDKRSPEPSLAKPSGPMKCSSVPPLGKHSGSKKPSEPSSILVILSKKPTSEPSLVKHTGSLGRLTGFRTSPEKLANSKIPSPEPSQGLAVKLHPTKPVEVGGLEPEVARLFPYLRATEMGTIVLWTFLWALLKDTNYRQVLRWIDQPSLKFKVFQPQDLARLWGVVKKNTSMNLEKLMKVIDLYVKKDILKEVDEKFVYQFAVIPESLECKDSEREESIQLV